MHTYIHTCMHAYRQIHTHMHKWGMRWNCRLVINPGATDAAASGATRCSDRFACALSVTVAFGFPFSLSHKGRSRPSRSCELTCWLSGNSPAGFLSGANQPALTELQFLTYVCFCKTRKWQVRAFDAAGPRRGRQRKQTQCYRQSLGSAMDEADLLSIVQSLL